MSSAGRLPLFLTTPVLVFLLAASAQVSGQTAVPRVVDLTAFRGQGTLAFTTDGRLYILDAQRGALRAVPQSRRVSDPKWSPDGRWLAFRSRTDPQDVLGDAWIVQSDGSAGHQALARSVFSFAWAPVGNTLALSREGPNGLWVITPGGAPREVVATDSPIGSFAWAPDGDRFAYSVTLPSDRLPDRDDGLYVVPSHGGHPVLKFVAKHDAIWLADWWPDGKGVLFWRDPSHALSVAYNGLPLLSLRLDGGRLETLVSFSPLSFAWSSDKHSLVVVKGYGRNYGHDRSLVLCDVRTGTCRPIPQQAGTVSFAPAWSPDGREIAFASAVDVGGDALPTLQAGEAWARTTNIVVKRMVGAGRSHLAVPAPRLRQGPLWSRDGKHILYGDNSGVWLFDTATHAVRQIVAGAVDALAWHR